MGKVAISVYLDARDEARLKAHATRQKLSVSALIGQLIKRELSPRGEGSDEVMIRMLGLMAAQLEHLTGEDDAVLLDVKDKGRRYAEAALKRMGHS